MGWRIIFVVALFLVASLAKAEDDPEILYRIDARLDRACVFQYQIRHLEREVVTELSLNPEELEASILWTRSLGQGLTATNVMVETWEQIGSATRGAFEGALYAGVMSRFALDRPRHLRRWFYLASVILGAGVRYVERQFLSDRDARERVVGEILRRFRPSIESVPEALQAAQEFLENNQRNGQAGECTEAALPARLTGLDYMNTLRMAIHFGKERARTPR